MMCAGYRFIQVLVPTLLVLVVCVCVCEASSCASKAAQTERTTQERGASRSAVSATITTITAITAITTAPSPSPSASPEARPLSAGRHSGVQARVYSISQAAAHGPHPHPSNQWSFQTNPHIRNTSLANSFLYHGTMVSDTRQLFMTRLLFPPHCHGP